MKYLLLFLFSFFFLSCSSTTDEIPASDTYLLNYNDTATKIEGTAIFEVGNIPNNHVVTLTNFRASVEGCSVDISTEPISPNSLTYTGVTSKQTTTIDITLTNTCTSNDLQIKADYIDNSYLAGKLVSHTKEIQYSFTINKVSTVSSYTPILKKSTIDISKNRQNESITVSVFDDLSRPAEEGTVNIIYPKIATEGVNVGTFSKTNMDIKSGEAVFSYTAPNDLQALLDDNISKTSFKFYYNSDLSNYVELNVNFSPEENQTVIKDYTILFTTQDENYKMSLDKTKSFSIALIDDDNNILADSQILDLNVSLENSYIADLINPNGDVGRVFHFTNTNNVTLTLQSHTTSGLVPIQVSALFIDVNGEQQSLNATYNIIVESGPPTAISISYSGTGQDKEHAKFIEHFVVSVTDEYFNPVNTHPQVSVGSIVGYAKYEDDGSVGNTNKRIYVDSGVLATLDGDTLTLNQNYLQTNTTIDPENDTLATFANGFTYPASGGWSIENYDAGHIYLSPGQYTGGRTDKVGFAIGRNHRQDACNFGDEWLGQAKLQSDASTIDDSGSAIIDLSYDYYLVGKDILVYINIIGKDNTLNKEIKLGEVKKHTLRGHGVEFVDNGTLSIPAGTIVRQKFFVWIKDTIEPYRNANFSFGKIDKSNGCRDVVPLDTYDLKACAIFNGQSSAEFQVSAKNGDCDDSDPDTECTGCSITVSEPHINAEF